MAKVTGWTYSITWGNPYTTPADGKPRTLCTRAVTPGTALPDDMEEIRKANPGYACHVGFQSEPVKAWPKERKAEARIRNMRKRIQRDAPLFAAELEQRTLKAHPQYFRGE